MKTHSYQRHEKRKSESDAKKSAERASRKQPSYPKSDDMDSTSAGNGAQDNDAGAEAENQGDNEDNEDGEDADQEGGV